MNVWYIYGCGVIALIAWIMSIQQQKKTKILMLQMVANVFYAIQYMALNAFSGCAMNIVAFLKGFIFYLNEKKEKKTSVIILLILIGITMILGVITYQNIFSIIPVLITILYTYSVWQEDIRIICIVFIVCACLWILYNVIVGAYLPLIGNIVELISGVIGLIRHSHRNHRKFDNVDMM